VIFGCEMISGAVISRELSPMGTRAICSRVYGN